jgi:hypothetical protein
VHPGAIPGKAVPVDHRSLHDQVHCYTPSCRLIAFDVFCDGAFASNLVFDRAVDGNWHAYISDFAKVAPDGGVVKHRLAWKAWVRFLFAEVVLREDVISINVTEDKAQDVRIPAARFGVGALHPHGALRGRFAPVSINVSWLNTYTVQDDHPIDKTTEFADLTVHKE